MPDAGLRFDIDSTQAQRAIAVLETLKATSISVTQANAQQTTSAGTLSQSYDQQRDRLSKLVDITKTYDGTLTGLVQRLDQLRRGMDDSRPALAAYATTLTQAAAAATTFNASIEGLDRYISRVRELRIASADVATGLNTISAALKNQTIEGANARTTLAAYGITLNGVGANRPDQVLQQIADQVRRYQLTPGAIQGYQRILGPSFDAQTLTALGSQPYVTMQQRIQTDRTNTAQAQIDTQQQQILRMTSELTRNQARSQDLNAQFTRNPSFLGRWGFGLADPVGFSDKDNRAALDRIAALPPSEQAQYRRGSSWIGRGIDQSGVANAIRNFTSGTYSANEDEIGARFRRDADESRFGTAGAILPGWGRQLANAVGLYKPLLTRDDREISPAERRYLREQSGGILSQFGDTSLEAINQTSLRVRDFATDDNRKRYSQAFGSADGIRRYTNQLATLQQSAIYAKAPEQQTADETNREQLILALPLEQRAQARFGLQFLGQQAGSAATVLPVGTPLRGITDNVNLSRAQRGVGNAAFTQQVAGTVQEQHEAAVEQITFQDKLTESLNKGRAAAEDFTRAETARLQVARLGASLAQQAQVVADTHNVTEAQRITQGRSVNLALQQDNRDQREQLDLANKLNAARATAVTRQRETDVLTQSQRLRGQVESGSQPSGDSPKAIADRLAFDQAQREARANETGGAASKITTGLQTQISDNRELLGIMQAHNMSLEQASHALEDQKAFTAAITAYQAAGDTEHVAQLRATAELQATIRRDTQLTVDALQNADKARAIAISTDVDLTIAREPDPAKRLALRANRDVAIRNLTDNQVRDDPGQGGRARISMDAAMRGPLQTTPEGAAALAANEAGETHIRSIQQDPRSLQGPGDRGGFGTMQWTGPRRIKFFQFAHDHQMDPADQATSNAFRQHELLTEQRYGGLVTMLQTPGYSATDLAAEVNRVYVRSPAGTMATHVSAAETYAQVARGFSPASPGMTPEQRDAQGNLITANTDAAVAGQTIQDINAQRQFAEQQSLRARRLVLIRQGQTGRAAQLQAGDPDLLPGPREADIARRTAGVIGGQTEEAAGRSFEARQGITDLNKQLAALREGAGVGEAALQKEIAAEQAHAEALRLGLSPVEEATRAAELYTKAVSEQRLQVEQTHIAISKSLGQQAAVNAAGPFATPIQQEAIRRRTSLEQDIAARPDAYSEPGAKERAYGDLANQKAIAEQTDDLNSMREAAHGAESAIEGAFTSLVVRGEKGRDVLKGMLQQFEQIALKQLVLRPFEKMLGSLFGGDDGSPGSGGNGGGNGGGKPDALTGALNKLAGLGDSAAANDTSSGAALKALAGASMCDCSGGGGSPGGGGSNLAGRALNLVGGGGGRGNGGADGGGNGNSSWTDMDALRSSDGTGDGMPHPTPSNFLPGSPDLELDRPGLIDRMLNTGDHPDSLIRHPEENQNFFDRIFNPSGSQWNQRLNARRNIADIYAQQDPNNPNYRGGGLNPDGSLKPAVSDGGDADKATRTANSSADVQRQSSTGGSGGGAGDGSSGNGGRSVFGHAGGLVGWGVDQLGGQGFYKGGGLIGSWFNGPAAGSIGNSALTQGAGGSGADLVSSAPGSAAASGGVEAGAFDVAGAGAGGAGDVASLATDAFAFAAMGGVFPGRRGQPGNIADFENQVIAMPTLFRFARGAGLMGEAGPEAIMPLKRGADGKLGIAGNGGGGTHTHNWNITTGDADSFMRSRPQIEAKYSASLNRTVARNSP